MIFTRSLLVVSLLALTGAAYAHAAADKANANPSNWKGTNLSLGGSTNTGNTTSQNANAALNIRYAPSKWTLTSGDTFDFAHTRGKGVTASKLYLMGQAQYAFTKRNYVFEQLNYTDDRFDGYKYVANGLAGLGRRILDYPTFFLDLQAGPGVQRSVEKQEQGGDSVDLIVITGTLNSTWNFSSNGALSENFNVASSSQNVRYMSTTSLSANVMNHVALKLSFQATRDSKPLPKKKATNTATIVSLVYTFA